MKIQTGFISSSSSSSISYSTEIKYKTELVGYTSKSQTTLDQINHTWEGDPYSTFSNLTESNVTQALLWKTYKSSAYFRIESFLEATEKMNAAYSRSTLAKLPLYDYSKNVALKGLYDGFVDIVITFPCEIRLAGIELLNPWNNKLSTDKEYNYWKYLPKKFSIFKVKSDEVNSETGEAKTYQTDVAKKMKTKAISHIRPIYYNNVNADSNMIFLGRYTVNWENLTSYKCFFKYNENDQMSITSNANGNKLGTATWECKQLVLRIFKGYDSDGNQYIWKKPEDGSYECGPIFKNMCEFILDKELEYGTTTYDSKPVTLSIIQSFYSAYLGILNSAAEDDETKSSILNISNKNSYFQDLGIFFGGSSIRRYDTVKDAFFNAGIEYKLGGIQLLLSPDIFSVSEMKMYKYTADANNNKVYIGEWNKDLQMMSYYGAGTTKTSELIDVSMPNVPAVDWRHNFNVPPRYLDVQVFAQFTMDYSNFAAGDVVSNLVNCEHEPLTIRLTGTDVLLNISKGVCFTNPVTGQFLIFKDGKGVLMDSEGSYDAYNAAMAVGANVLATQSIVGAKIEAEDPTMGEAYPFKIYFVVKRLF